MRKRFVIPKDRIDKLIEEALANRLNVEILSKYLLVLSHNNSVCVPEGEARKDANGMTFQLVKFPDGYELEVHVRWLK